MSEENSVEEQEVVGEEVTQEESPAEEVQSQASTEQPKWVPFQTLQARTAKYHENLEALQQENERLKQDQIRQVDPASGLSPTQLAIKEATEAALAPLASRVERMEQTNVQMQNLQEYNRHRQQFRDVVSTWNAPPEVLAEVEATIDAAQSRGQFVDAMVVFDSVLGRHMREKRYHAQTQATKNLQNAQEVNGSAVTMGRPSAPAVPPGEEKTYGEMSLEEMQKLPEAGIKFKDLWSSR